MPARVGLVGNPSDGYGGAVLAAVVDAWCATVSVTPIGDGVRIRSDDVGTIELALADAATGPISTDRFGDHALVVAAVRSLRMHLGDVLTPVEIEWSCTIPRSVGLAGSSAIAVGVIEAVAASRGFPLEPRLVGALALEAERVWLGIAAGWQDRMVQAHRGAVLVDAAAMDDLAGRAAPMVQPVRDLDVEVMVGWLPHDSEDSGRYHDALRRRADRPGFADGMVELAALARRAAACAAARDRVGLGELVDASWQVRCRAAPLRSSHARLVEAVRAAGVPATSPGSGGSVVALPGDRGAREAAVAALEALGAHVVVTRLR